MIIRKATRQDSETIATHLLLAMEDIVYRFIGEAHPLKAKEFMRHFTGSDNNQYSYQNCWVAEDEQGVMGAVNLYDGARLQELRQPVIEYIRSRFDKDFSPEDETQAGEYYIDTIGVAPQRQGKGTGTRLLQFIIEEYVHQRRETLGLLVDEANPNAQRLYARLGFRRAGKKFLFGKYMEHLQLKG